MEKTDNWAEDSSNWGPAVIKLPILQWVSKDSPSLGVMLTDTFAKLAKDNGFSYVAFQFKKGEAKELFMADSVNCTPKEFNDLIEAIIEEKEKK